MTVEESRRQSLAETSKMEVLHYIKKITEYTISGHIEKILTVQAIVNDIAASANLSDFDEYIEYIYRVTNSYEDDICREDIIILIEGSKGCIDELERLIPIDQGISNTEYGSLKKNHNTEEGIYQTEYRVSYLLKTWYGFSEEVTGALMQTIIAFTNFDIIGYEG